MKRIFDFFTSLLLLFILAPILLILMLTIKLTSNGPIFFTQRRIGRNNKEFILFKFRTMKIDTPNVATHLLEKPEQYITLPGKILRKSSLDELPQLINILKGDMTYVGPRPALYNQYDLIHLRTKAEVHRLLPGVTGWAQINGRDAISIKEKVKYDRYYLQNKSTKFDLKIVFLTVLKVLRADGVIEGGVKTKRHTDYNKTASV